MLTVKFMLCAEGVIRDAATNILTIYNVMEILVSEGYPLMIQRFHVVTTVRRTADEPAQIDCAVQLKVDEKEIGTFPVHLDFQDKFLTRSILQLQGFVLEKPGTVTATFLRDGQPLSTYDFEAQSRLHPVAESAPS